MRRLRWESGILLAASLLLNQGCSFKKEPRKASPQMMQPPPQLSPPEMPAANQTATQEIPTLPPPVDPPRPLKPRPVRRPVGNSANGVGAVQEPAAPAGLSPTLQPILGIQEIGNRNRKISQYLEKARSTVLRAERANPTSGERELIAQVRTFVQQAEEARRVDLVRAENLAERAEVLSRALVK